MDTINFKEKFLNDKGTHRLISNLVFTTIRNFNFNPKKYLPTKNPIFQKIVIKGGKAYKMMLDNLSSDTTSDIDAEIFIDKNIIKNVLQNNQFSNIIVNSENQLKHIGEQFANKFNKKINFKKLNEKSNNYTNMIYLIQLDAIVNKYFPQLCKNSYLLPSLADNKRCYNCKVIHQIKEIIGEKEEKIFLLKFAFQFDFKETFITRNWNPVGLIIPFFDITIANLQMQIENSRRDLHLEISPALYILRPNLILDNLINMASQPNFFKKNKAKNRYNKLIRVPFTNYSCSIIDKLTSNNNILERKHIMENPVVMLKNSNEIEIKENMQKHFNNFILHDLGENLQSLTENQKNKYKKMFIKKILKNIENIGNLDKEILLDIPQMSSYYSNILGPYKNFVNVFYNSHANYTEELKEADKKCKSFKELKKPFTINSISNSKNNVIKFYNGILTTYKKKSSTDNNYPKIFYNIYKNIREIQSLFNNNNTEIYRGPIIKMTSFSYWKFFTNIETEERIKNTVWPKPVCLDELEINKNYFVDMNIPNKFDVEKSKIISRDFLSNNGFLIIIYPLAYLNKKTKNNIRNIEIKVGNKKDKKIYKFYNSKVKFIQKIPSYQKVIIDGIAYLDKINILVFHELP